MEVNQGGHGGAFWGNSFVALASALSTVRAESQQRPALPRSRLCNGHWAPRDLTGEERGREEGNRARLNYGDPRGGTLGESMFGSREYVVPFGRPHNSPSRVTHGVSSGCRSLRSLSSPSLIAHQIALSQTLHLCLCNKLSFSVDIILDFINRFIIKITVP